jgi:hypothetical protein
MLLILMAGLYDEKEKHVARRIMSSRITVFTIWSVLSKGFFYRQRGNCHGGWCSLTFLFYGKERIIFDSRLNRESTPTEI